MWPGKRGVRGLPRVVASGIDPLGDAQGLFLRLDVRRVRGVVVGFLVADLPPAERTSGLQVQRVGDHRHLLGDPEQQWPTRPDPPDADVGMTAAQFV